jgi:hypothetical protein
MPSGATISRQTFTPGTAPVAGYEGQFYFNAVITSNAQNYEHGQFIENARTFAGQTVTFSFWARSTVGAQPMNVSMFQNFGTGGSPSSQVTIAATSGTTPYTPTSSWVRYIYTFDVPSVSGKTFGTNNDSYLWVRFGQYTTTATNTSVDYWGVQLEAGSVATAFQTATGTIQGELAACQRYYYRQTGNADNGYAAGFAPSTTSAIFCWQLPVSMRIAPTSIEVPSTITNLKLTNWDTVSYTISTLAIASGTASGTNSVNIRAVSSGLTTNQGVLLANNATVNGFIGVSAEL